MNGKKQSAAKPTATVFVLLVTIIGVEVPLMAQSLSQQLKREAVEQLAAEARQAGNAVRGAILFTRQDLHCTLCHHARDAKPMGPDLNSLGKHTTDVHLVEALLEPSKHITLGYESVVIATTAGRVLAGRIVDEGPERVVVQLSSGDLARVALQRAEVQEITPSNVSAMPDSLVDQLNNRQEFLDLVRYLMELAAADARPPTPLHSVGNSTMDTRLQGVGLLKEFNCQACHIDDVTPTTLKPNQAPNLLRSVGRIDPHFIQRFVADPLHTRPGTRMPDVMTELTPDERQQAALELTHYLVSLSDQRYSNGPIDPAAAERGRELFHSVGCVACHSPRGNKHEELLAETSVPLGPVHGKYSLDGLRAFLENPLEVRPAGRMPQMQLSHWEAVDIASYLHSAATGDSAAEPFRLRTELIAKGRKQFTDLGCSHCHAVELPHESAGDKSSDAPVHAPGDVPVSRPNSLALSKLRVDRGCLSKERGGWPLFDMADDQRAAIRAALEDPPQQITSNDHLALTMTSLRCLNCHERDQFGGVSDQRDAYFQTSNPNLGPQGRIPPPLTGVGAKLNANWMRQVLVSGRAIRPYVATRMPQFGTENVAHLVDLFQQVDQMPQVAYPAVEDEKKLREVGAELVGTGGLNCIACHTFQLQQAANMPAVDLTEMAERLKKDWFYHYMRDPQRLSRNTIMPSFWPAGRTMRKDVLDGDPELQLEAIWQYLLDGRQARTPRGLIVEPMELLATDEAVMLRRSYPGVGKRGIGVGYPRQVNVVFDAEQLRLAMIWHGQFADPGGVWRSQGHGTVRPLGNRVIRFSPGPDLDQETDPWLVDEGRPTKHRFLGYSLDDQMRPRFQYQFDGIRIEDYATDELDAPTDRAFLRRTLTLTSDAPRTGLTFRVASGKSIVAGQGGRFTVDEQLQVLVGNERQARVVSSVVDESEIQQLQLLLDVAAGVTTFTVEYRW